MDMRNDGRRLPPRNSRGEFRRRRRGDRGMDYGYDMDMARGDGRVIRSYPRMDFAGDMDYDMARGGRGCRGRGRGDRGDYDMRGGEDMRSMDYGRGDYRGGQMSDRGEDYGDMRRGRGDRADGHYMHGGQSMGGQTYYPIEAMGRFNGYWGMPEQDYGRGRDYGYGDMGGDYARGGRRDYGDYGYGDYGDYGETLSEEELKKWEKKLMGQLDEREKQMFSKETIMQKAKSMGKQMEGFGEKELFVTTLMVYTDYKNTIGQNPDLAVKLAFDWLSDKDVSVKGAEKLAVYYDCIVEGE